MFAMLLNQGGVGEDEGREEEGERKALRGYVELQTPVRTMA